LKSKFVFNPFTNNLDTIPSASDTQIFFSDGGYPAGSANMTFDKSAGGSIYIAVPDNGAGNVGDLLLYGGKGTGGNGGSIQIQGQTGTDGTHIYMDAGDADTSNTGASIYAYGGFASGAGGDLQFYTGASSASLDGSSIEMYGGSDGDYSGQIDIFAGSGAAGGHPAGWITLTVQDGTDGQQGGVVYVTGSSTCNTAFAIDGSTVPLTRLSGTSTFGYSHLAVTSQKAMGDVDFSEYTPILGVAPVFAETVTLDDQVWGNINQFGIYFLSTYNNVFSTNTGTSEDGKDIGCISYAMIAYEGFTGSDNTVTFVPGAGSKYNRTSYGAMYVNQSKDTIDSATLPVVATYYGVATQVSPNITVTNAASVDAVLYGIKTDVGGSNIGVGSGVNTCQVFGGHFSATNGATSAIGIYASGDTAAGAFNGAVIPTAGYTYSLGYPTYEFAPVYCGGYHFNKVLDNTDSTFNSLDDCIVYDGTALISTLPAATGSGKIFHCSNINATELTITPDGSDTIDGESGLTLYQWESVSLVDYASNAWKVI